MELQIDEIVSTVETTAYYDKEAAIFVGFCPRFKVYSQGETRDEALIAVREAVRLRLTAALENGGWEMKSIGRPGKVSPLRDKEYRDAFVAAQISIGLPFQIRALRDRRGWNQSRLAAEAGMLQPRISAMERPGESKFNLETLRRIASAFDVALEVRFVPFSELVDWSERFSPDEFQVVSFDEDMRLQRTEVNSKKGEGST